MKVFLPANFIWMAEVFLFILIGMGMSLLLYFILDDKPSKLLSMNKNIEGFFVEINSRKKKKWLLRCSYNPAKMQMSNHAAELNKSTDLYLTIYDQILFSGNFNAGVEDSSIKNVCSSYNLTSMINSLHVLTLF